MVQLTWFESEKDLQEITGLDHRLVKMRGLVSGHCGGTGHCE